MNAQAVLKAELRRTWIQRRRYMISTITNLISFGILVFAAWVGLRAAFFKEAGVYGASAALLWPLVLTSFGIAAGSLKEDIDLGTIEQLYLSAPSVLRLLHLRALVGFLDSFLFTVPFLLIGGYYLGWSQLGQWILVQVIPLWISLYGLGLVIAGLTLRYRQLGTLTNLLGISMMALAVVELPLEGIWIWLGHIFPMVGVSAEPVWPEGWWLRYLASALYLAIGVWAFRSLEVQAKRRGLIGKY